MIPFVVVGCVPAKVLGRDFHRRRNVVAVGADEIAPRIGIVISETSCIFTLEGNDVRPHIAGVGIQLRHRRIEIEVVIVGEQSMRAESFRAGAGGDVLHVPVRLTNRRPVFLQRHGDEHRSVSFCRMSCVVLVLSHLLHTGKICCELCNELLLLSGWRTVIGQLLNMFAGTDVAQVPADLLRAAALEMRTFNNQLRHHSSPASRMRCSKEMRPFVSFTFLTLCARIRRSASSPMS